tara:strand:+ start:4727 stop:5113 length:387 start_codon:yes stop_codon:yes gene_type:complete
MTDTKDFQSYNLEHWPPEWHMMLARMVRTSSASNLDLIEQVIQARESVEKGDLKRAKLELDVFLDSVGPEIFTEFMLCVWGSYISASSQLYQITKMQEWALEDMPAEVRRELGIDPPLMSELPKTEIQ